MLYFAMPVVDGAADWSPLRATEIEGLRFRERYTGSACGQNGEYYWYEFQNVSTRRIEFFMSADYDNNGKRLHQNASHALDPGKRANDWWCVSGRSARVIVSATPPKTMARSPARPVGVRTAWPSISGVRLDSRCKSLLARHREKLRLAGVTQAALSAIPLLDAVGPPHEVLWNVTTTDWKELVAGIQGVQTLAYSSLATEALLHSAEHSADLKVKLFWKTLSDAYGEAASR
jgi:hypothetical protein